jgi:hypothetical protein
MKECTFCNKVRKIVCLDWRGFWCHECYLTKHEKMMMDEED